MRWKLGLNLGQAGERMGRCQGKVLRCIGQLWMVQSYRRKVIAAPFAIFALPVLFSWMLQSNSCAFNAFFYLILFDVITLIGDLLSQMYINGGKASTTFSFGFVRVEVLCHFAVSCMGLLLNFWAIKNCLELVAGGTNQDIHTGRFIPGVIVGGLVHFFLSFNNNPFLKVFKFSATSTTLQKYFQGIWASFGLPLSSPFYSSPLAILGVFAACTLFLLAFALQTGPRWFDLIGSLLIIAAVFDALWPLCLYTGQVLLQTVPHHIVSQLEKSLREALTIDGVLEFQNELFWTLNYGQIAGTMHVRVRRDAHEQFVLSKVYEKLQPLAPYLTVQVTKDDFGRPFGNFHILRDLEPSLTQVTVGSIGQSELSPIPKAMGHMNNHLIYSTVSRNDTTQDMLKSNSTVQFNDSNASSVRDQIPWRNAESSHVGHGHNDPSNISVHGSNHHGNHSEGVSSYNNRNPMNGRHNHNPSPFVVNNGSSNTYPASQNLLLNSANFFPEES